LAQINHISPSGEVSFFLMNAILEIDNVSVRRGDKNILGPLNWQVLEGQRWVVLGPNGAGKTTLLQVCSSLIHPTILWDESRAMALLTALGVRELGERHFGSLSDGEKKRVQIARALMADPELLLLDEPASSLDLGGREDLLKRIEIFAKDPLAPATVIVTHHIEEIPSGTTHALLLKDGKVVAQGVIDTVITDENLSHAYGLPISVQSEGGRFFARAR